MCGRYVVTSPVSNTKTLVKSAINISDISNYNAHPSQNLPVIKKYLNGRTLENLIWGITPDWANNKKNFKPLINARIETINEKVSFKNLISKNRCVAIADGFYEWKRDFNNKIPYYFTRYDKKTIYFAAIYKEYYFCIITEEASSNIIDIHHRQPVIINEKEISNYLNVDTNSSKFLLDRVKPKLIFHKVSKNVNIPKNNDKTLITKI